MSTMNDFGRRVNSIIVKNLPVDCDTSQLEELFSKFGRIMSSKVLPHNPNFEGACGFVNYADAESCSQAVENMNNFSIGNSTLRVSHSSTRPPNTNFDRQSNGFRTNDESNGRTMSAISTNQEEQNGTSSPSTHNRFSGFRPASERSSKPMSINSTHSSSSELDAASNGTKPLWNSSAGQTQPSPSSKSSFQNGDMNKMTSDSVDTPVVHEQRDIEEHELFVLNETYNIYLSNLEVPSVVFAATLEDYVRATLLITQMNKHEQLAKVQANSYKSKLTVGQICAALFNGDWYRARVLELGETRVRVQYIDWGNTGSCDSMLEIRPLPNEYFKDPVLCVKCFLDDVSSNGKLTDDTTNAILNILVLDHKLEMTVTRLEKGVPYVRLNLGERNLNNEVRAILPSSSNASKQSQLVNFDSNKPEINPSETHAVQLTTVDTQSECFHILLMRDCLSTIMNVLRDWNASKQPLMGQAKANMLVCAQYDADDLWYRAWIESVTENGYRVYFVDFGNEEIVSSDRISECPDNLKTIPWQSVQVKLANIKLTDEERYVLLRDFETDRLEMKVIQRNQDIYLVELFSNGKSLVEHIIELRKKQQSEPQSTLVTNEIPKTLPVKVEPPTTHIRTANENLHPVSLPVQSIANETKQSPISNKTTSFQPTLPITTGATSSTDIIKNPPSSTVTQQASNVEQKNESAVNDNLVTLITEQRRQNRLLEQVIAAINTTNALLNQLVQR